MISLRVIFHLHVTIILLIISTIASEEINDIDEKKPRDGTLTTSEYGISTISIRKSQVTLQTLTRGTTSPNG